MSRFNRAIALALVAGCGGCGFSAGEGELARAFAYLSEGARSLTRSTRPTLVASPSPSVTAVAVASPTASPSAASSSSPLPSKVQGNSEFLYELYHVVLGQEPRDRADFSSWVDTINQGASYEGVYNGFTHSSDYRKWETNGGGASPGALRIFSDEMALLQDGMPAVTEFQTLPGDSLPVAVVKRDNIGIAEARKEMPALPVLSERYSKTFVGNSIFTLKRVLGDEVLRAMDERKGYREKLALWYSRWVVHLCSYGVDFALPLRNRADEAFHYQWALSATEDRLKWEALNRVHRLLNEANHNPVQPIRGN